MDRQLLQVRGAYLRPDRPILADPVTSALWHADAAREIAQTADAALARRLMRIASEMERHAEYLAAREAALIERRNRLQTAVEEWRRAHP